MNTECSRFRRIIPMAILGDLGAAEKEALEQHVAECAPCRDEQDLYLNTVGHLRLASDVPAPRHFFVYDAPASKTPWWLFRQMPVAWQSSLAAAFVVAGIILVAGLAHLQVRAGGGALTIAFGALPAAPAQVTAPGIDIEALENRILAAVEQRDRQQSDQMLRTLREEIANSNRKLTRDQRAQLQTALDAVEARMARSLSGAVSAVQTRSDNSIAEVYQAVTLQQQRDRNVIENRIDRLAVSGAAKSSQTDAILETLLEVAELRMK
jgi:hypothetical protein